MNIPVIKNLVLLLSLTVIVKEACASDSTASNIYSEGRKLYLEGEYYDAAEKFEESRFYAKSPVVRANTLIAQMASYRMCKLYYREFQIIEQLLERFPEYVDCNELIAREFEIGKIFRTGFREPSFWVFRWVPFWTDVDRTAEVYTAALKRSPYSKFAPDAHMQLAIYYDLEGKTMESLASLRAILERHPRAPERKYAMLALANGLFMRAGGGDGDSRYINEAEEYFKLFCKEYPDASEVEFARNKIAKAKDIRAGKLFEIAEFYRKRGRSEVAERYLAQVMNEFPDSESAPEAEKILVGISDNYLPGEKTEIREARYPDIRSYNIPADAELLLVSPLDKDSPYLLPVNDIKGEKLKEVSDADRGNDEKGDEK